MRYCSMALVAVLQNLGYPMELDPAEYSIDVFREIIRHNCPDSVSTIVSFWEAGLWRDPDVRQLGILGFPRDLENHFVDWGQAAKDSRELITAIRCALDVVQSVHPDLPASLVVADCMAGFVDVDRDDIRTAVALDLSDHVLIPLIACRMWNHMLQADAQQYVAAVRSSIQLLADYRNTHIEEELERER